MAIDRNAWGIDEGITDPAAFFSALPEILPTATHLELEGDGIASEARALYAAHADGSPMHSRRQALSWSRRYRCPMSPPLLSELKRLAGQMEPSQLFDHLAVFAGEDQLLDWHDAFANALLLAADVPEERVRDLASRFGVAYERA